MTDSTVTIEVATIDLRRALTAVKPHAERNKTGDNAIEHRVRFCIDSSELYVIATNGQTTGVAVVPIQEDDRRERFAPDDGAYWVDLQPKQVALALQHFPVSSGSGSELDEMIRLRCTPKVVTMTDVGGLFAGDAAEFTQLPFDSTYPDVLGAVAVALANRDASTLRKPLVASGALLKLFDVAAAAYEQPVEYCPTGSPDSRGFVVMVGDRFVGTVESRHNDDDGLKRRNSAFQRMLERFPAPAKKLAAV